MATAQDSLYNCFPKRIEKNGQIKERWVERPKPELRRIQKRLVHLLDRIQPPDYLHSGFRGRSYTSNAFRHDPQARLAKIDIRKFFPSAYAGYVYRGFVDEFLCSHDVAAVLARLTTAFGHLPTGGNSSTIISFFAFKPMFDEVHCLATSRGLVMTCCVDDMTFSGEAATAGFLNKVRVIVRRFGLKTHKRHCFEPHRTKVVTGVALTPRGFRLPNARRRKLHEAAEAFDAEKDPRKKVKLGEQLLGRTTEAAQVEQQFSSLIPISAEKSGEAKRAVRQHSRGS
jgi:RNA-directed DNA polymerase